MINLIYFSKDIKGRCLFLFYHVYLYFYFFLDLKLKKKKIIITNRYLLRQQFYEICVRRRSITIDILRMFTRNLNVANSHIMYKVRKYTKYSK